MSWFWPSKAEVEQNTQQIIRVGTEVIATIEAKVEPPPDPEPDLSTKPADIVGYCFGFACPKKHVQNCFESVTVDGYKDRRACDTCGAVAKPCVVRRIAEARWEDIFSGIPRWDGSPSPKWKWTQRHNFTTVWTRYEFFHYLETPKRRKK